MDVDVVLGEGEGKGKGKEKNPQGNQIKFNGLESPRL